jgi:hypothetical protein
MLTTAEKKISSKIRSLGFVAKLVWQKPEFPQNSSKTKQFFLAAPPDAP